MERKGETRKGKTRMVEVEVEVFYLFFFWLRIKGGGRETRGNLEHEHDFVNFVDFVDCPKTRFKPPVSLEYDRKPLDVPSLKIFFSFFPRTMSDSNPCHSTTLPTRQPRYDVRIHSFPL